MLTLTRKTDYALVALAAMAEVDASELQPLSARQIAERFDMPQQVLGSVLKDLHRADLIGSTRGAHGGYYLRRSPAVISLADVAEALEGRVRLTPCCADGSGDLCAKCGITLKCPISGRIKTLNEKILGLFEQVTLADLLADKVETKMSGFSLSVVSAAGAGRR